VYEYKATVIRVLDGDTLDAKVSLGFRVTIDMRFRLARINAPELRTQAGKASAERLRQLMPVGGVFTVKTEKDKTEKYGRYLGTFFDDDGDCINDRMVQEHHAFPY
jgi:micrococcal nuclease